MGPMNINALICRATGASKALKKETIQTLWNGYGHIIRYELTGCREKSVVVKHVKYPRSVSNEEISDIRKRRSYHVETAWYQGWARLCGRECAVPRCFGADGNDKEMAMVLEDMDAAGYPARVGRATPEERELCVRWLAHFHARFLGERPEGLWEAGTYWHLETRPEELDLLEDEQLKAAAPLIDRRLRETAYPTIVHGDAKLANFCFRRDRKAVAAVDFQYAGGGCGMKDLAYLGGDCFFNDRCEESVPALLDTYFSHFRKAMELFGKKQNPLPVEEEWRELFPYAWADFHRFLKGWTPGRWSRDDYSERISREVASRCLYG